MSMSGVDVQHINLEALQRRLRGLGRRYNELVEKISEVEFLADAIQLELSELSSSYELKTGPGDEPGQHQPNLQRRRKPSTSTATREALQRTAEAGVVSLNIRRRANGHSDVRVDDGQTFSLPPLLADLLGVLSMDNSVADGHVVAWKSLIEIAVLLEKRSGKTFTPHAVTQSIHRLRNRLYYHGRLNPFLVQTNPKLGARFALRRKAAGIVTTAVVQPTREPFKNKGEINVAPLGKR